ncbi:hypothetical protein JCM21142_2746 [Saccharicrinis fermentans DSM 9555 = JCM 21142]|uniref:DUF4450 domain-containing protein n=2 Tax=Saccharicrinis fermentans TaxID=982 RepID=W7YHU0_9BACT|nr:hypothetical protein JCM21142_2746 [Saccharicrinis fermentans DSM 9555 = JCM 21142]
MTKYVNAILYFFLLIGSLGAQNPDWSLLTPKLAGTLRLGVEVKGESKWFSDFTTVHLDVSKNQLRYILADNIMGGGTMELIVRSLEDSQGAVMKLKGENIVQDVRLIWMFGGASNKEVDADQWISEILPEDCLLNVFSIEGQSFTLYYGSSQKLRVLGGLVPSGGCLRLADARKQAQPLCLLKSGKKTRYQVVSSDVAMTTGKDYYFCFYFLNPRADYNYFMLPKLFKEGSYVVNKETEWMKSTPD